MSDKHTKARPGAKAAFAFKVGDRVHAGFGVAGGAGVIGTITKIEDGYAHIQADASASDRYGPKTYKARVERLTAPPKQAWESSRPSAKTRFGIWGDAPDKYRAAIDFIQNQRTPSSAAMSDLKKAIKRKQLEAKQQRKPDMKQLYEDDASSLQNILEHAQRGDDSTFLRAAFNLDTAVRDDIPIEMFIWAGADVNWSHRNAKSLLDTVSALVARSKHGKSKMAFDSKFNVGDRVVARVSAQGMKKGQVYTVTDIEQQVTPWGTFVDYKLDNKMWVGNGHLVLDKATNAKPRNKMTAAAEGRVVVDGVEYRVLPYQVEYFKADLAKFDDPKWRKQIVRKYLAKNYIIRASRPGAKARMGRILQSHEVDELKEFLDAYGVKDYDIIKSIGQVKVRKDQVGKALDAIASLNREIRKEGIGGSVAVDVVPFSRPGAKATMAAHPENIAWMRSLPAPVVAKVREILTKPHSGARAKALRDALKSGGVSYNKWIPDASAGAEVLGHQFQEAFAKPSDLEREDVKAGLKLMEKADKAVSDKIRTLIAEGKPQDQAVAIALDMKRRGEI